jgi:hypothetical protein
MKPFLSILMLVGLPIAAWGPGGHRLSAEASLRALPPELRAWYSGQETGFREAALEPDRQKAFDPEEDSRHHLHTEVYGGPAGVPFEAQAAVGRLGAFAFLRRGQLPWAIGDRYRKLVEAFRAKDGARVVTESGWLSHYVSDAQVPLHCTRNSNGKETAQKGVHKRWEDGLVDCNVTSLPSPRMAQAPTNPTRGPWAWIAEAHALLPALLAADEQASRDTDYGKPGESRYWARFWTLQQGTVTQQLQRSAERTADLLLAAWIEAGRPAVPAARP